MPGPKPKTDEITNELRQQILDSIVRDKFIAAALNAIVSHQWEKGRLDQLDVAASYAVRYADAVMAVRKDPPIKSVMVKGAKAGRLANDLKPLPKLEPIPEPAQTVTEPQSILAPLEEVA